MIATRCCSIRCVVQASGIHCSLCWQDLYLEDILKFIGYKAPGSYSQESGTSSGNSSRDAPLVRLQAAATEQAIMDAFLKGDEGSWERLLEVTGAQEGSGNPACINVAHLATGEAGH